MFYQSPLDIILGDEESDIKAFLRKIGVLSFMIPDCKNLLTPLNYCFEKGHVQLQTTHLIIE